MSLLPTLIEFIRRRRVQVVITALIFGSILMFRPTYAASVTVTSPNGGECLTPGSQVTVTWSGEGFDHVAIGYKTDGSTPKTYLSDSASWDVHPAYGSSFKWDVPEVTSTTVKLWIEAHQTSHSKVALDSSNANFTISDTCGTEEEQGEEVTEPPTTPTTTESEPTGPSSSTTPTSTSFSRTVPTSTGERQAARFPYLPVAVVVGAALITGYVIYRVVRRRSTPSDDAPSPPQIT